MKKSILIVYSLLILPLFTSFIALSMENPIESIQTTSDDEIERCRKMIKITHAPVINELLEQFTNKKNLTTENLSLYNNDSDVEDEASTSTIENIPLNKSNPIEIKPAVKPRQIYDETVEMKLPEHIEKKLMLNKQHTTTPERPNSPSDLLLQSVILPTEERPLSFIAKFSYYTSTSHTIMTNIIKQLETKTFDTSDATSFTRLKEAITTATNNADAQSLLKIAMLCEENYPNKIRIDNDDLAQQANKLLSQYYITELNITNELLQQSITTKKEEYNLTINECKETINKIIDTYQQEIKKINNRYNNSVTQNDKDIKKLKKQIRTFSNLNKSIRLTTEHLLNDHKIKPSYDILATTIKQTNNQLSSMQKQLSNIPTILESKKPLHLALEQKK